MPIRTAIGRDSAHLTELIHTQEDTVDLGSAGWAAQQPECHGKAD
jgi:hypothetical protein